MSNSAATDLKECDIIMKGGITSGVVYPRTILKLKDRYRFRSIGGTSAGAIAAVLTAAAEYNRAGDGFAVLSAIPNEIGAPGKLESLFQPAPSVRAIFNAGKAASEKRFGNAAMRLLCGYPLHFIALLLVAAALAWIAWPNVIAAALLLLTAALTGLGVVAYLIGRGIVAELTRLDFGCCPGPTQPGNGAPALCDWLADRIEMAAGRMNKDGPRPAAPLTFGDIWGKAATDPTQAPDIDLRMMTTNLSLRRPNTLPVLDGNHYFREEEFRRLFPAWIVDHLVVAAQAAKQEAKARTDTQEPDLPPGFLKFPSGARLPIIVGARMSLSFPLLFTAVPLYRVDHPHWKDRKNDPAPMQRMLFSDGGLSSNFPMHFFDAMLPRRPTFGVAFGEVDPRDCDLQGNPRRVRLPHEAGGGIFLDCTTPGNLLGFLIQLVNAAKDWQDRLQSTLPGYRERIATVFLTDKEGGLNLAMPPELIQDLVSFGERAGALMAERPILDPGGQPQFPDDHAPFDFDDHRWRRFLVAFARLEETLQTTAKSWQDTAQGESFAAFIKRYKDSPGSYKPSSVDWGNQVFERFDGLMKTAAGWSAPLRSAAGAHIPRPPSDLRITPKS